MFAHDRILREDMPASGWDDEVLPLDQTITQEPR